MSGLNIENQPVPDNNEINRRIVLLEATLLEKARTREVLEDSEKRYRRLFESAKDGILILDADTGKIVDVNPFLLNLLGYSYDALHGQYIWELGVFKDIAASKDAFATLQDHEYIRYDDLPLETSDGKPIAVEFV
ncbi:MAG: PAS domain S-box protein, partial [Smithellaceae bacterium]